jgi:SAM-dependent methyltransferase
VSFDSDYTNPNYWDRRTPLYIGTPKLVQLYQDLNDNKLRKFLSKLNGLTLDAGCGNGRFIEYATIGVDFSRGMLSKLKRVYPKKVLVRASLLALPFKDCCFNHAFSIDVLNHIRPEDRVLAQSELHRVSDKFYVFLHDRSVLSRVLSLFRHKNKFVWFVYAHIAVVIAFITDRIGSGQ